MNLEGERDYSAVRTPVLDFLIRHELFRIELAQQFGAPVVAVSRRGQRDIERTKATYRERRRKKWELVFKALGGSAGTSAIAAKVGQSNVVINSTLNLLVEDGFVTKKAGQGRKQSVWNWIA